VTEIFQKPQSPRGAHAGVAFVKDNFLGFARAAQFEDVMDHVHECLKRRFTCVN
jgi:hypothetical protein